MIYSVNFIQHPRVALVFVTVLLQRLYFGSGYYYYRYSFVVQRVRTLQPYYMKNILCYSAVHAGP